MRIDRIPGWRWFALTVLIALVLETALGIAAGAGNSGRGGKSAAGASRRAASVAEELGKIRDEWAREMHAKQLDQVVALYAPDAVFLPPTGNRISGQAAIRALFKGIMEAVTSDLHFHSIVTESSGDLAYDSGDWTETLTPVAGGPGKDFQGNYVIVFRRGSDGHWLIVEHVWTVVSPDVVPAAK